MEDQIREAINRIRPALQNDGGDIDFLRLDGNKVVVKLKGACAGCPMSQMTLTNGVLRYLHKEVSPDLEIENEA